MTDLVAMIEAMPADERRGALAVLDALSRPLTAREIETVLRGHRVTRSQSEKLAHALKGLAIIALVGRETGGASKAPACNPPEPTVPVANYKSQHSARARETPGES